MVRTLDSGTAKEGREMQRTYRVTLVADAEVRATVEITADTPEEAELLAEREARGGDVVWQYSGTKDETLVACPAEEVGTRRNLR